MLMLSIRNRSGSGLSADEFESDHQSKVGKSLHDFHKKTGISPRELGKHHSTHVSKYINSEEYEEGKGLKNTEHYKHVTHHKGHEVPHDIVHHASTQHQEVED